MILWPTICRIARRLAGRRPKGKVIWMTGLSGSGKTTIAEAVECILQAQGYDVELLDGDRIRDKFPQTGFSKEERDMHVKRVGFMASVLEKHGVIVLCSLISPYRETRETVREMCADFTEVYIDCPLSVCARRDPKGLYRRAYAGEIKNFTGIDDPYERPLYSDLYIPTNRKSLGICIQAVLDIARR